VILPPLIFPDASVAITNTTGNYTQAFVSPK
jgi:hypothetical protein